MHFGLALLFQPIQFELPAIYLTSVALSLYAVTLRHNTRSTSGWDSASFGHIQQMCIQDGYHSLFRFHSKPTQSQDVKVTSKCLLVYKFLQKISLKDFHRPLSEIMKGKEGRKKGFKLCLRSQSLKGGRSPKLQSHAEAQDAFEKLKELFCSTLLPGCFWICLGSNLNATSGGRLTVAPSCLLVL
jgi:hypothetical protein